MEALVIPNRGNSRCDIRSKREQSRVWREEEDTGEITRHEVDLS